MDFSKRHRGAELIDDPAALSSRELEKTMAEFRAVNRLLSGGRILLKETIPVLLSHQESERPIRVADFGTASADIPVALVRWARRMKIELRVAAVDFNPGMCRKACSRTASFPEIELVQADVRELPFKEQSFDLVLCSSLLHHFEDSEIPGLLKAFRRVARSAVVITDLHRHPLAYAGIRLLTLTLWRSRAARHDGPLSVLKGFRKGEIQSLLNRAGVTDARIHWRFPFRFCISYPGRG